MGQVVTPEENAEWTREYESEQAALVCFLVRNHYITGSYMPDGRVCFVKQTIPGGAQICISSTLDEMSGVSDLYSYDGWLVCSDAWASWAEGSFAGEPEGWVRHQPSNRRRRDGDPSTEEIRP